MHQRLHDIHRRPGTNPRRGLSDNFYRRIAVIAFQTRRAGFPARGGEGGEGDHAAIFVTDIPKINIIRQHTIFRCGLNIDFLHATTVHKVVDVARSPGCLQGVVDIVNRYAQRLRFPLVNINLQLRAVVQAVVAHAGQGTVFPGQLNELISCGHQRVMACSGVIL